MARRVAVIEGRNPAVRPVLKRLFDCFGWTLDLYEWDSVSLASVAERPGEILIADTVEDQSAPIRFLSQLKKRPLGRPSLAIVPAEVGPGLIELVSGVTDDFLLWPAPESEIKERLLRLHEESESSGTILKLIKECGRLNLIGRERKFLRAVEQMQRAAEADVPVLISGETGSGKELVARSIHFLGKRRNGPFVPIDCGAVPESLFENELFGHARGAFTGAHKDEKGLIEIADGGVLFLDEVDSMPLGAQSKLLRFLQERTYRRLGRSSLRSVDVNILAATGTDLRRKVERSEFRSDLYFRLNVLTLALPPLRDRVEDIPLLARHHLRYLQEERGSRPLRFSRPALNKLVQYSWPGNVRELFNVVQRAAVLCSGRRIGPEHILLDPIRDSQGNASEGQESFKEARARAVADFERSYLVRMLAEHDGNITRAARAAGKERRAFGRLVKKHGIDPKNP